LVVCPFVLIMVLLFCKNMDYQRNKQKSGQKIEGERTFPLKMCPKVRFHYNELAD